MPLKSSVLATSNALRAVMVSRAPRTPNPFVRFCAAERKAGELPKGMINQQKALSAKWKGFDDAEKKTYEVQAEVAKGAAPGAHVSLAHNSTLGVVQVRPAHRRRSLLRPASLLQEGATAVSRSDAVSGRTSAATVGCSLWRH